MTWPPADGRERITTHREGGWIVTGACGRPHLAGRSWSWWHCPACTRRASRDRLTSQQSALLSLFYPDAQTGGPMPTAR